MYTKNYDSALSEVSKKGLYIKTEVIVKISPKAKNAINAKFPHYLSFDPKSQDLPCTFNNKELDGILSSSSYSPVLISHVFGDHQLKGKFIKAELKAGFDRVFRVKYYDDIDVLSLCDKLNNSDLIEYAEPNYVRWTMAKPNDAYYKDQWGLHCVHAEGAWDIETGHRDIQIGVIDTGIYLPAWDIRRDIVKDYDFVDPALTDNDILPLHFVGDHHNRDCMPFDYHVGHGTHVTGIAAALGNNRRKVCGVCWNNRSVALRALFGTTLGGDCPVYGGGVDTDISAALVYAATKKIPVINMSFGGTEKSLLEESAVNYAFHSNTCLIAAAGNSGNTTDGTKPFYPASFENVMAVGAIDKDRKRASFSNHGVDACGAYVMAPGVNILSTYLKNKLKAMDGTSMAAPFVAGTAGLIISHLHRKGKSWSPRDIYTIIEESADRDFDYYDAEEYGKGILNMETALKMVKG